MRKSIGSSFLFLRSRKGGGAYESDLNMAGKQSTKSKKQSKPKEEIIMSKKRSIKVYGQSGYKYRETPTIMLKGMWLKEAGFDVGDYISVTCEDGKIVIAQDAERAAVKAAEAEFMDREMKALQKRYEAEKVKIRAQMVAEPGARW
jgi:toxic protein SymE